MKVLSDASVKKQLQRLADLYAEGAIDRLVYEVQRTRLHRQLRTGSIEHVHPMRVAEWLRGKSALLVERTAAVEQIAPASSSAQAARAIGLQVVERIVHFGSHFPVAEVLEALEVLRATQRPVDLVVTRDLSRISRDERSFWNVLATLEAHSIPVYALDEGVLLLSEDGWESRVRAEQARPPGAWRD